MAPVTTAQPNFTINGETWILVDSDNGGWAWNGDLYWEAGQHGRNCPHDRCYWRTENGGENCEVSFELPCTHSKELWNQGDVVTIDGQDLIARPTRAFGTWRWNGKAGKRSISAHTLADIYVQLGHDRLGVLDDDPVQARAVRAAAQWMHAKWGLDSVAAQAGGGGRYTQLYRQRLVESEQELSNIGVPQTHLDRLDEYVTRHDTRQLTQGGADWWAARPRDEVVDRTAELLGW